MRPFDVDRPTLNKSVLDVPDVLSGPFWGELRIFLAVAKSKSFNRAAELLHVSQPTVSRQVRRLQDLMGSQLLIATKHGVTLTPKGLELARSLSALDHSLYTLTNDLKSETREAEGMVRVSLTDGLNILFVAPKLATFGEKYPRIRVHLRRPVNVTNLHDNQADIMVAFNTMHGSDITVQPLGRMHFLPMASYLYVEEHGMPTPETAESHHFLMSEYYAANTGVWDAWHHIATRGYTTHYCDNSFAYGMLVKAGLGIGLLGNFTVREPTLTPLPQLQVAISVPMYMVALTERLRSRPVRLVYDWLTDLLGPRNPWFRHEFSIDNPESDLDPGFKALFSLQGAPEPLGQTKAVAGPKGPKGAPASRGSALQLRQSD